MSKHSMKYATVDSPIIVNGQMVYAPANRLTVIRRRIAIAVLATLAIFAAMLLASPDSHADSDTGLSRGETAIVVTTGESMCKVLETSGVSKRTLYKIFDILDRNTDLDSDGIARVVAYSVTIYCPHYAKPLADAIEPVRQQV